MISTRDALELVKKRGVSVLLLALKILEKCNP